MLLKHQSNVSPFRGMPIDDKGSSSSITDQSGETVQFKYNSSGTLTNDAGQAAGVVVMGKFTYDNIRNALGDMQGKKGDTSLSFTCLAMTSEVGLDVISPTYAEGLDECAWTTRLAAIGAKLSSGQYWVDYANGVVYVKKATTASTMTSTAYKYAASAGAGSISAIIPGTGATNLGKAEDAVHASGDVGIMSLAVANEAQSNFAADGDYVPIGTNRKGSVYILDVQAPNYEEQTINRALTFAAPITSTAYNLSIDKSAALEASSVTKASAGNLYWVSGRIDSTAPTGTYYYQILSAASLPADGAVTFLVAPMKLQHTTGIDTPIIIGDPSNAVTPIAGSGTGLVECLSSTEFTKTITAAYLSTTVGYL